MCISEFGENWRKSLVEIAVSVNDAGSKRSELGSKKPRKDPRSDHSNPWLSLYKSDLGSNKTQIDPRARLNYRER